MSDQDRTENGRKLAASLRRAAEMAERGEIQEVGMDLPIQPKPESRGFADGAAAERHLRENVCPNGTSPYGPYIPPNRLGISLEEKAEVVWFLPHHIALFKRITPPVAIALGDHAVRLADRRTVSRWWQWAWKIGLAIIVAAFSAARWGVNQIGLIRDWTCSEKVESFFPEGGGFRWQTESKPLPLSFAQRRYDWRRRAGGPAAR